MNEAEKHFNALRNKVLKSFPQTHQAKMMSAEGIGIIKKVVAFFYRDAMVFKLGKDFKPDENGISNWEFLNPFKNKPPMKAWFIIPYDGGVNYWEFLLEKAIDFASIG